MALWADEAQHFPCREWWWSSTAGMQKMHWLCEEEGLKHCRKMGLPGQI